MDKSEGKRVCVVGAGLSGSLVAILLAQLGLEVTIFEKRPDPRATEDLSVVSSEFGLSTNAAKRSINLALSTRGMVALKEVGILDAVMENAIPMPCRFIHSVDGTEVKQPYGQADEAIWSVGREVINNLLLDKTSSSRVTTFFEYTLQDVSADGLCCFQTKDGKEHNDQFDLVIGADGAFSQTRECLLKKGRINFSRRFVPHGYKELTIPPSPSGDYALKSVNGLHIWPRQNGAFMLIALPNPDKSFTATLFAPYEGLGGFDSVDPNNPSDINAHFEKYFPDVVPFMPDLVKDYQSNPVGSLVTVRVKPWNIGKMVLLGDAAHAVVPFYGQGMNAGFQDGYMFYNIIKRHLQESNSVNLAWCAKQFSQERQPAADALADLCLEHYYDMAANTASTLYLLKKRIEGVIAGMFPQTFLPLYSMVAFSEIPYHEAVARAERQDKWLGRLLALGVVGATGLALVGASTLLGGERRWCCHIGKMKLW